jgi:hypothetical protein
LDNESRLAKIISYLFHPLLMSSYGLLILFYTRNYISVFTPPDVKLILFSITFFFTFLLPTINAFILLKMGRIKSLHMETSEERIIPYASTALYYFALVYLFSEKQIPVIYRNLILGAGISILLTLIINFKWKISAHSIGIGGLVGAVFAVMYQLQLDIQLIFILLVLCSGIVAYARLKLNAHTPVQVYTGLALGFFVEFMVMI